LSAVHSPFPLQSRSDSSADSSPEEESIPGWFGGQLCCEIFHSHYGRIFSREIFSIKEWRNLEIWVCGRLR